MYNNGTESWNMQSLNIVMKEKTKYLSEQFLNHLDKS
jgi:hypothetical protein